MAELFLAPLIQLLFDQLSGELLNFARRYVGLEEKLDQWRGTLRRIQAVLHDAEEKQHTEGAVIKQWLDDLRDLAYDVEDILDEFATEALQHKLKGGDDDQARPSKVRKLIHTLFTGFTPSALKLSDRLGSKIDDITARFINIVTRKDQLNLKDTTDHGRSNRRRGTPSSSTLVIEDSVYGRKEDKDAILQMLLSEIRSDAKVSVIPILGMGGIGKTTLAKLLFKDEKVQNFFDVRAWVYVSEDFDVAEVTKKILRSIRSKSSIDNDRKNKDREDNELDGLQDNLVKELSGKKFLVVLDDLWNECYVKWDALCVPFEAGAPGSTIIITTRNESVSTMTRTIRGFPTYQLQVLPDDDCLSLFTRHALGTNDFSAHPKLQDVGEEIVKRCKGLPLAAVILGGLLRNKQDREWEGILKSRIWTILEKESTILPVLMLSYDHLPSHLKRCFMYCSILPKDHEFEEQQLVLLWIADGLIHPQQGENMQMEDLGRQYFRELLSRSFFQQSNIKESQFEKLSWYSSIHSSTKKPRFVMHDLINDLAQWVARDICFRMEDQIGGRNERRLSKKVRYSSYLAGKYDIRKKIEPFFEFTCLRTFMPLPHPSHCYLSQNVPIQLLSKLKSLRALSLSGYQIVELPNSIGDLKLLRYLDLSYTCIRGLPESTTTLCNLQTMILERCSSLKKLPSNFCNLVNLRHLNILDADELEGMPPQIGKLTHLQTLSNLIVGKGNCFALRELGSLSHLRGALIISQLENAIEPRNASDAKLIDKTDLTTLCLEWSVNKDDSEESEFDVLRMLRPHNGLKELTILQYGGTKFPTWFGHSSLHMVLLRIENCKKCTSLPPVGHLPSLKHLLIRGMASVKDVGVEFYGVSCSQPFESLETLHFEDMAEWEKWSPNGEFPNLRELSISNCPKLLGTLPNHFPSLGNVFIQRCQQLVVSISSFPKDCVLQIERLEGTMCDSKVDFSSLDLSSLSRILEFTPPPTEGLLLEGLTHVEYLAFTNCEELTPLWSNDVGLLQHLPNLRVLKFDNCSKLVSLAAEKANEQPHSDLPSTLRVIYISRCNVLASLPKAVVYNNTCLEEIEIDGCDSLTHIARDQLPPTLKRLEIKNCKNMLILLDEYDANRCSSSTSLLEILQSDLPSTSLPKAVIYNNTCLEYIKINGCDSLKHIARGQLPPTLKRLWIQNCWNMQSLVDEDDANCCSTSTSSLLEELWIRECHSLKFVELPATLQELDIYYCRQLESIAKSEELPATLQYLQINCCDKLVSIAKSEELPASLKWLRITNCEQLESITKSFHHNSSLENIYIYGCENLKSLPTAIDNLSHLHHLSIWNCSPLVSFPDGGSLPCNLRTLEIPRMPPPNCIHTLTSLKKLYIDGGCPNVESFTEKMLPASLTNLTIDSFHNLKYMSSLQSLTSLETLEIRECKNLTSFPKDGLPPSLQQLIIRYCPLLKEHCKKDQGREWSKIAHIPYIQM